jgi:hypothetical protein
MSLEATQEALKKDDLLAYSGPSDVSLLNDSKESLIEVYGDSYIKRASFQFVQDQLYVIILALNQSQLDHYSVYSALVAKYGKPSSISPAQIIWQDGSTQLSLERPLSVKYLDLKTYGQLISNGAAQKSYRELDRVDFLNQF